MANMQDGAAEGIQKQPEVVEVKGNVGHGRLQWTNVMSGFVLRHFCDLVAEGVKTDKGFKEVHLNQVANSLKEFTGQDVTGTQVYNHLRKWRARWVKICRLKDLNGTGWDKDNFMITMEPDHYNGHVKMQIIFGSGVATGAVCHGFE
ncbi:hypothetical protein QOZ80_9BG0702420 [Eleusine coracana subsp. coracana]|nr:hypothetical protein QOZ80_9BG0702420 [Eleusine coracana subsp. coracana]